MADAKQAKVLVGGGRGRQRLTYEDAAVIRTSSESLLTLGQRYGMAASHIGKVRRGEVLC